ncbi:hypothetical protein VCRA2113O22_30362 [Vibrio crassostreae]|nr:hypothetical protein VCRA2116O27_30060 [Vibrio crassostreae]CAK2104182.1 hypothetical protein VCRA2113O22_30362 [Vibrio crassostreae]CAK2361058.1 hypothetical protein VCRA2119O50_30364 [Vibrio crassostreae]CAK2908462.1 hypothetical protein VCRA2117O35_30365 [Vibrio crassostreae]CAK2999452.1 hypothetical protein VCRA2120O56_30282 [Vibrio crassostreae]
MHISKYAAQAPTQPFTTQISIALHSQIQPVKININISKHVYRYNL